MSKIFGTSEYLDYAKKTAALWEFFKMLLYESQDIVEMPGYTSRRIRKVGNGLVVMVIGIAAICLAMTIPNVKNIVASFYGAEVKVEMADRVK